jgi:hypothetical protein
MAKEQTSFVDVSHVRAFSNALLKCTISGIPHTKIRAAKASDPKILNACIDRGYSQHTMGINLMSR